MKTLTPRGGAGHSVASVGGEAEQLWVILLRQAEECGPVLKREKMRCKVKKEQDIEMGRGAGLRLMTGGNVPMVPIPSKNPGTIPQMIFLRG